MRSIGIDFGTTTSLVGECTPGRPSDLLPLGRVTRSMPSAVGQRDGRLVAGEDAENLPLDRVVRSVKRAITRDSDHVGIEGTTCVVNADEAITAVLRELAARTRRFVALEDGSIRLGCPAMWTGPQRERLLQLARQADLPVTEHTLVDEPIAAGVAWVSRRTTLFGEWIEGKVLVFDMGGGTLDIAHLEVAAQPGRMAEISVLSATGLDEAGDVLDDALLAYVMDRVDATTRTRPEAPDPIQSARLRQRVGEMKLRLSTQLETSIDVGTGVPLIVPRAVLEMAFKPQLDRAEQLIWATIRASQMTHQNGANPALARSKSHAELAREVDYVILVGGMSRVPAVASRLHTMFPRARLFDHDRELDTIAPDEIVAAGLSSTSEYEDLNLHRPGFDFQLRWSPTDGGHQSRVLYPAYTPLYSPHQAMTKSILYYEAELPPTVTPSAGEGRLFAASPSGKAVQMVIDGEKRDGLRVPFGRQGVRLRIYTNGKILLIDGQGSSQVIQISRWPVVRGFDHWQLQAKKIQGEPQPLPELTYPWGPQHG